MWQTVWIAVIAVCISLSGVWEKAEEAIGKWLKCRVRIPAIIRSPFSETHWASIIYLLIKGNLTIANYGLLLLLCTCTPVIEAVIRNFIEIILKIVNIPRRIL